MEIIKKFTKKIVTLRKSIYIFLSKPENFFLTFASIIGFVLVFLVPPIQSPDEQSHFFQAYAVSNLDFTPERFEDESGKPHYGAELPRSVYVAAEEFKSIAGKPDTNFNKSLLKLYIRQPLEPSVTAHLKSGTTYSPLVYVPQAIGITVGKLFNASPLIMIWLGRLANLAVWLAMGYLAVKLFPIAKWALVVFALSPMALFISASLSADVVNIGLAFLFFSMTASVILSKKTITKKQAIILVVLLIAISLTKPVNLVLGLLLFAIPWRAFKSKVNFLLYALFSLAIAASSALLWNYQISEATQATVQLQRPSMGVDPTKQLDGIVDNPINFINVIVQNYVVVEPGSSGDAVLITFFGVFGWLDTYMPLWAIIVYASLLFLALLYQFGRGGFFSLRQKALIVVIFCVFFAANVTALYLAYTPVGSEFVQGVQGRYFIPLAVLVLGLFTARKKILNLSEKNMIIIISTVMIIVAFMMLLRIFLRYYAN